MEVCVFFMVTETNLNTQSFPPTYEPKALLDRDSQLQED